MNNSNLSVLPASGDRSSASYPTSRTFDQLSGHSSSQSSGHSSGHTIFVKPKSLTVESVLEFDWHKLTALGVSVDDAQAIAQTLALKKIMFLYWRRLLKAGAPFDDARRIARAIAKYDTAKTLPTARQRQLITQYCPFVCRSGLWRAELLLNVSR